MIQVVCWVELPGQRRLCPIFVKIRIPINGTQQVVSGHLKSTGILQVDELSTGPPDFGCHTTCHKFALSTLTISLAFSHIISKMA